MTRAEKVERATALRREGLKLREIAERMGAPISTVDSWVNDPDLTKHMARRRKYGGTCLDCGVPTDGSRGAEAASKRCDECAKRHRHDTRTWTPQTVVDAIRAWASKYGEPPSAAEWTPGMRGFDAERYYSDAPVIPPASVVQAECGSWNAAIRLAGFTPRPPGCYGRRGEDPEFRASLAERYRKGESAGEIASAVGMSRKGVEYLLHREGVRMRSPSEARRLAWQHEQQAA